MTDVTNEHDVSDLVNDHNAIVGDFDGDSLPMHQEADIQTYGEVPENAIIFKSMDGKSYLIDKTCIDWDQTADNIHALESNVTVVRQSLMSLFFDKKNADTSYANTEIKNLIVGLGCTPKYSVTFPNADEFDTAVMYCIDALELMNIIISEIKLYLTNKSVTDLININQLILGGKLYEDNVQETVTPDT